MSFPPKKFPVSQCSITGTDRTRSQTLSTKGISQAIARAGSPVTGRNLVDNRPLTLISMEEMLIAYPGLVKERKK